MQAETGIERGKGFPVLSPLLSKGGNHRRVFPSALRCTLKNACIRSPREPLPLPSTTLPIVERSPLSCSAAAPSNRWQGCERPLAQFLMGIFMRANPTRCKLGTRLQSAMRPDHWIFRR